MDEGKYQVGQLATMTGLTVRTLQHYDNVGLLPASGRDTSGRKFYVESDVRKLEQIVFYKNLGFPLREIAAQVVNTAQLSEMDAVLAKQSHSLQTQVESIHTSLAAIEGCREVIRVGKEPPWPRGWPNNGRIWFS